MVFSTKPTRYIYGLFSDLQGAWSNLRDAVLKLSPSHVQPRLLFHIDEAMRWDSVYNVERMKTTFLVIRTIVHQEKLAGEILDWIDDIQVFLDELSEALFSENTV